MKNTILPKLCKHFFDGQQYSTFDCVNMYTIAYIFLLIPPLSKILYKKGQYFVYLT